MNLNKVTPLMYTNQLKETVDWYVNVLGFTGLGILAFTVFGLTEIYRMVFSLNYVNGLREKYFTTTDESLKQWLEYSLNNTGLINDIFFRIFIVAFATG